MTLIERTRLVGLTALEIAKETGLDRMTVHRCLAERRVLSTSRDAVLQVLAGRERQVLMRLLDLHGRWLKENNDADRSVAA